MCSYEVAIKAPRGRIAQVWSPAQPYWTTTNIDEMISRWFKGSWEGHLLHNDEDPIGVNLDSHGDPISHSCGHVKGVLAFNSLVGVYLIHSCPKWPKRFPPECIPDSETVYGQSFAMLTFHVQDMAKVVENLSVSDPNVYRQSNFPYFKGPVFGPGHISYLNLSDNVTYISKNRAWNQDIYSKAIVPYFKTPVRVVSWLRPPNQFQDDQVEDVQNVFWNNGIHYHSKQDHSKFCVGTLRPICYIGSMNHMLSQHKRGGDGVIICDHALHHALSSIMEVQSTLSEDRVHIPPGVV